MGFQKGNKLGGRPPREKDFYNAMQMEIAAAGKDADGGHKKLRAIAKKLLDKAEDGEPWAVQMVAERVDGKAVQAIEADMSVTADDTIAGLFERVAANGARLIADAGDTE